MKRGYIKLWRKIKDNPLWREKRKISRFEAWIDLILSANGMDKEVLFDGKPLLIKRGQLLTSERKLAQVWGWSKTKTRDFLKHLQNHDHAIEIQSDHKKTIITIKNYKDYNPLHEEKKTTQSTKKKTTERPLKNHRLATTKKDKESNNEVNLYIAQIIDHWNSKGIKIIEDRESKVKNRTITKIKAWLKDYELEEIVEAIDNYFQILKSEDHYFSHEWQLWEFLDRGLTRFLTKNKPFENWLKDGQEYKVSQIGKNILRNPIENEEELLKKIDAEYKENLERVMKEEGWETERDVDPFQVPSLYEYRERRIKEIKKEKSNLNTDE